MRRWVGVDSHPRVFLCTFDTSLVAQQQQTARSKESGQRAKPDVRIRQTRQNRLNLALFPRGPGPEIWPLLQSARSRQITAAERIPRPSYLCRKTGIRAQQPTRANEDLEKTEHTAPTVSASRTLLPCSHLREHHKSRSGRDRLLTPQLNSACDHLTARSNWRARRHSRRHSLEQTQEQTRAASDTRHSLSRLSRQNDSTTRRSLPTRHHAELGALHPPLAGPLAGRVDLLPLTALQQATGALHPPLSPVSDLPVGLGRVHDLSAQAGLARARESVVQGQRRRVSVLPLLAAAAEPLRLRDDAEIAHNNPRQFRDIRQERGRQLPLDHGGEAPPIDGVPRPGGLSRERGQDRRPRRVALPVGAA